MKLLNLSENTTYLKEKIIILKVLWLEEDLCDCVLNFFCLINMTLSSCMIPDSGEKSNKLADEFRVVSHPLILQKSFR